MGSSHPFLERAGGNMDVIREFSFGVKEKQVVDACLRLFREKGYQLM
jgi:hypothetical protein